MSLKEVLAELLTKFLSYKESRIYIFMKTVVKTVTSFFLFRRIVVSLGVETKIYQKYLSIQFTQKK